MFASAGAVGVIEDFVELFEKTLSTRIQEGKISSLLSVKMLAEDLVSKEEERYAPRIGRNPLQFLLGGLSDLKGGNARLYEIGFGGFGQIIKFSTSVGHGDPYARTIMKYLFPRNSKKGIIPLVCQEIVGRMAACIYWIGGGVDDFVGGQPQILYMLDKGRQIKEGKYNKARVSRKVNEVKDILRRFEIDKAGKQRVTKKAPNKN